MTKAARMSQTYAGATISHGPRTAYFLPKLASNLGTARAFALLPRNQDHRKAVHTQQSLLLGFIIRRWKTSQGLKAPRPDVEASEQK